MKIHVIGGGPAGLYFALLMKRGDPAHRIAVVEQNPADATYGWGVVLSDRALSFLQTADPASYADIAAELQVWHDQVIVHRGQRIAIGGSTFSGIQRLMLLQILQRHCEAAGVRLEFNTRVSVVESYADCDLLIGADGVNSLVRGTYRSHFEPTVDTARNKFVWYGTGQPFDGLTLTFRENVAGTFVAHSYRYSKTMSTFIVECDHETWTNAGLAAMSDAESRRYCEEVFRADLGGYPLLSNKSAWINFNVIQNRRWHDGHVLLLGDALRTVHFSIGSGTRTALEDAIALRDAFAAHPRVEAALLDFEQRRRPQADRLLDVAARSLLWYEDIREKMRLDPVPFVYDYMTRGGRVDHEKLRQRDPRFVEEYERYLASRC